MANLYQLSNELMSCIQYDDEHVVNSETGEILDLEEYNKLEIAVEQKIENVALYIKNKQAEADMIKAEADKLAERARIKANEAKRCKEYLTGFMTNVYGGKKFESARVKLGWRASEVVEVNGIDALPDEYLKFKDPEPDKAKIKADLKLGKEIKGCQLVSKRTLQIK